MFTRQGLHLPGEIERDVHSKYSIRNGTGSPITDKPTIKGGQGRTLKRYVRFYQCLCGSDTQAQQRLIPWRNVNCCSWVRVVTTHDESNPEGEL